MKKLRFLLVAGMLAGLAGLDQTNAQAYIEKGSEYKPLEYESGGDRYFAWAHIDYQYEGTPSGNFNWSGHGYLIQVYIWDEQNGWVMLNDLPKPKKTVKAVDPNGYDEKVTINPRGKVTVVAHTKIEEPWW